MRLTPRFLGVARNDEGKNVIQSGVGVPPVFEQTNTVYKYASNKLEYSSTARSAISRTLCVHLIVADGNKISVLKCIFRYDIIIQRIK